MVTPIKFREMVLDNKDKLSKLDFNVKVANEGDYKFIIHRIKKTSLTIVVFIRYENMVKRARIENKGYYIPGNPLERYLRKLISSESETEFDLKMETKIKKPKLFKEKIPVKIEDVIYDFKISGAGDYAVKLSLDIPINDINTKDNPKHNPLENKLKNIIYYISTDREKTWDMDIFQIIKLLR